jgi:hypothetical protein
MWKSDFIYSSVAFRRYPEKPKSKNGIFAVRNLKNLKYQCAQLISLNLSVKDDKRDACETEDISKV